MKGKSANEKQARNKTSTEPQTDREKLLAPPIEWQRSLATILYFLRHRCSLATNLIQNQSKLKTADKMQTNLATNCVCCNE
jgi:hypothetical protein